MKNQLPPKWQQIPFKEVAEVVTGTTPSKKYPAFYGGNVPFITPAELCDNGSIMKASTYLSDAGVKKARLLPEDTILVTCIGTLGKIGITDQPLVTNQQINSLIFDKKVVFPKYAYFYCKTLKPVLETLAPATTVPIINKSKFSEIRIPLPPLSEQKRIAAILDKADAIHRKQQQAIKLADEFLRATFLDMFGDPVINNKDWPRSTFEKYLDKIESGWSPKCLDREACPNEWGVLKLGAVTTCNYNENENKALPDDKEPRESIEVKKGDLLFTRKNTYDLVAACAYVFDTRHNLMISDTIFRLKLDEATELRPEYLWALLTHPGKRKQIQSLAGGSAGSMPNISKGRLLKQEIEVPPLDLQTMFANIFHKIREISIKHVGMLKESDDCFGSISQRAFRGEL